MTLFIIVILLLVLIILSLVSINKNDIEYYQGLTSAFIDLATYSDIDSYLYQ